MKQKFVEVSDRVREVLRECAAFDGVLKLPERDLGKKLYGEVKRVIEAADGRWSTKHQGFTFDRPALSRLNQAITDGIMPHRKQSFQEFFTPPDLAFRMAAIVVEHFRSNPIDETTLSVLEPSAGTGVLVQAILEQYQGASVCACEIQKENLDQLPYDPRIRTVHGDFLKQVVTGPGPGCNYHVVLMNPPFGGKTWAKHVQFALNFLRQDGILVAVVPRMAKLEDLQLPDPANAKLTPLTSDFGDTGVKVSLLTYRVHPKHLKLLKPITERVAAPKVDAKKLKSPDFYMKQIRKDLEESMRCLDELEAMLHEK